MNIKRVLGAFAAGLVAVGTYTAQAADKIYWLGAEGAKWSEASNWYPHAPGQDSVRFNVASNAVNVVDLDVDITVNDLRAEGNTHLIITNSSDTVRTLTSVDSYMSTQSGATLEVTGPNTVVNIKDTATQDNYIKGDQIASGGAKLTMGYTDMSDNPLGQKFIARGQGSKFDFKLTCGGNLNAWTYKYGMTFEASDGGELLLTANWRHAQGDKPKYIAKHNGRLLLSKMYADNSRYNSNKYAKIIPSIVCEDAHMEIGAVVQGYTGGEIVISNGYTSVSGTLSISDGNLYTDFTLAGDDPVVEGKNNAGFTFGSTTAGNANRLTFKLFPTLNWSETKGRIRQSNTSSNAKIALRNTVKYEIDCSAFKEWYGVKTNMLFQQAYGSGASYAIDTKKVTPVGEGADKCTVTFVQQGQNLMMVIDSKNLAPGSVARIGHYGYLTLQEAVAAAKDGQTIYLLDDVTLGKTVFVDKNVTLDLGTYNVRGNVDGLALTDGYATKDTLFCVLYGGALTVKGTGEINYGGNASVYSAIKLTDANDAREGEEVASLTVEGGTIVGYYYGINGHGNRQGTAITVNGGTIRGTAENDNAGIFNPQAGTLTVNGGAIEGAVGIYMKAGVVATTVKAGTIAANGIAKPYQTTGDGFVATGDALVIDNAGYPGGAPAADIVGGTFTSANGKAVASYAKTGFTPAGGFLRGGLYNTEPDTAFIAEGFKKQPLAGEWWRVSKDGPVVATINGYEYETLAEAYDAAEEGETILLVTNEATTAMLTLTKNVTIDLGTGCELKPAEGDTLFTVDGGNVTISGATLKGGVVLASGTLNMNATIDATGAAITANGGTLNVTGGSYTGTESAFVAGADFDPAKSTIDSGSFSSEIPAAYLKANRKMKEVGGRYVVVLAADETNITYTWKGGAAGDWANEANWTPSTTPCFGIPTKGYGNAQVTAKFPSNTPLDDWNVWINLGGGDYQVNGVQFLFSGILNLTNGMFNAQAGMISVGDTRLRVKDGVIRTTDPIFGNINDSNFNLDGNVQVVGDISPSPYSSWQVNAFGMGGSNEVTGVIHNRNAQFNVSVWENAMLVVNEIKAENATRPLAVTLLKGATMKVGQIVAADVTGKLDFTFNVEKEGYAEAPISFQQNAGNVALDGKTAVTVNIDEGFVTGSMPLFSGVGLSGASQPSVTVKVGGTALEPSQSLKIGLEEKDGVIYLSVKKNGMMLFVK